jgi:aminoglycoside 6'-N-acetyltransferase
LEVPDGREHRIEIRGSHVVLRPLADGDATALLEVVAHPAVAAWWGAQPPGFPLTDEPTATRFAILEDGEVAGMIQYSEELDPDYRHASIDLFVDSARHGRGLGSDAVRTLADHLVAERGHHRVTIDPAAENHAAIRAYEKAGFRQVGIMRAAWKDTWTGAWRDTLFMERVSL